MNESTMSILPNHFWHIHNISNIYHFFAYLYEYKFDVACNDGTFGHGCINNCSGQCVNDSPCNKTTGHCDNGCKPGYTSAFCNKSMCSCSFKCISTFKSNNIWRHQIDFDYKNFQVKFSEAYENDMINRIILLWIIIFWEANYGMKIHALGLLINISMLVCDILIIGG